MGLADVVEGLHEADGPRLREGQDFAGQGELRLVGEVAGERRVRPVPGWALLAWQALEELAVWEASRALPRGLPYHQQPAWKAELWRAYWHGRRLSGRDEPGGGGVWT